MLLTSKSQGFIVLATLGLAGIGTQHASYAEVGVAKPMESSCELTPTEQATPPKDPNADPFGSGPWYINESRTIWAGWDASQMRSGGNKVLWIRPEGTNLAISGRRLDAASPPLEASIPCCYPTGFQATGLTFPSGGCWLITATAGESKLTFITVVR